jgi:hypothetical protein
MDDRDRFDAIGRALERTYGDGFLYDTRGLRCSWIR